MKLICITPQEDQSSIIYLKPDTALLRNNEAFYLPEFSDTFSAQVALVVRIKKIGKKIAERFTHRYYDEVSMGLCIEATDLLEKNKQSGRPWDEAIGFDYSAPIGQFIPKTEKTSITLKLGQEEVKSFNIEEQVIHKAIADASDCFTLKIGDLIYITPTQDKLELSIGQETSGTINTSEVFKCCVK